MDENKQYGQAITKPLSYGCIKRKENPPTLMEFNQILDRIPHEDKIGHFFIVDIKFHNKNPKTLSCLQLLSGFKINEEKYITNKFSYTSKTHSTLEEKKFIPLYAEHLYFVIKRVGWLVTKIYEYYSSEQAKFKREFVIMNQKSRQKASTPVE